MRPSVEAHSHSYIILLVVLWHISYSNMENQHHLRTICTRRHVLDVCPHTVSCCIMAKVNI